MVKAEFVYKVVIGLLQGGKMLAFCEIAEVVKRELGDEYNEKQLRNGLYVLCKKNILKRNSEKEYLYNEEKDMGEESKGIKIFMEYKQKYYNICKEIEDELKNPFEKFEGDDLLEASKLYELNKKVKKILDKN